MGGTAGRRPAIGMSIVRAVTATLPALTANLALEIAPVRVNLIAAGFVDTPLSAELLGEQLEKRRNQLRTPRALFGTSSRVSRAPHNYARKCDSKWPIGWWRAASPPWRWSPRAFIGFPITTIWSRAA